MSASRSLLVAASAWLVCACSVVDTAPASGGGKATVTGTVTYLQRVALTPEAVVTVRLVDVSRADAPSILLGEQKITAGGRQVPFAFEIAYDPARIQPQMTYAVQARIEEGGRLRFISDRHYPVITRGAPTHVDMVLTIVGEAPK
jgi:putative lipoprotein